MGKPIKVFNVDGTPNKEGTITHFTRLKTEIDGRIKRTAFLVAGLGKEKIILGLPWLQKESPIIDWEQGTLQWKNESPRNEEENEDEEKEQIAEEMKKESKPIWIRAKFTASQQIAQKKEEQKKALPLRQQIPKDYHDYLDRFDEKTASRFPKKRPWDHKIELKEGHALGRSKKLPLIGQGTQRARRIPEGKLSEGVSLEIRKPSLCTILLHTKKEWQTASGTRLSKTQLHHRS